ncbi:S8 family serine peptidase [Aeoliella sp. SH292]|uniref:S8 family serine peptidase n=1 Tax=Aeoliella sp. SH292 TaxID=3454464 RepID=UPI003F994DB7
MSNRRKKSQWRQAVAKRLKRTATRFDRFARLNGVESLERREMMAADTVYTTEITSTQAANALVRDAFVRFSDLSRYSNAELENATRWVVVTDGTINANNFKTKTQLNHGGGFAPIANTYYALAGADSSAQIIAKLQGKAGVKYFYPEVSVDAEKFSLPNDPLVRDQWHLRNTGQGTNFPNEVNAYGVWGADIRVEDAWEYTTGDGVYIAIVDDSVFYAHPDLAPNYDDTLDWDYTDNDNNPTPNLGGGDFHGTAVAGLIGAKGNNGKGITGVAYDATLTGIRLIGSDILGVTSSDEDYYNAMTHRMDIIDIYNNSWGFSNGRAITDIPPFMMQGLIDAVFLGRNRLGVIHVNASGNSADIDDRTDHDSFASSMYTISITGFGPTGTAVGYAEGGSSIWVTAPTGNNPPGNGIVTTDVFGNAPSPTGNSDVGYNDGQTTGELDDPQYTANFNGTSAASPIAAGVVGLIVAAARDNGVELSLRDIKNILALSARRIDPTSPGWRADARPLFFDPPSDGGVPFGAAQQMGPGVTAFPTMIDPATGDLVPDLVAQFANATNSAGYFIHDTPVTGYGHGAIDAAAAVKLASTWKSVGTQHQTRVFNSTLNPGLIPSAQTIDPGIVIPGSYGGFANRAFAEYFDLWLNPPDELPDPLPTNGRGGAIEIIVPAGISIEDIEVTLDIDIAAAESDKLRMTLISPDGTHSELTNWIQQDSIGPLTATGNISHTFTTVRHWGERSEGVGRVDPLTGDRIEPNVILGANDEVVAGVWQLVFENWSGSDAVLNTGSSVTFHGSRTPANEWGLGGRIQGSIGLDTNQDGDFNFIGTTATLGNPVMTTVNGIDWTDQPVIAGMETQFEPMVAGVTVYIDIDKDGVRDATEPFKITGADGNYYFDVAYTQPGNTYQVRFELPAGYTSIGDTMHEHSVGRQADDTIRSLFMDSNFLIEPAPIMFQGNVFADFNANATRDHGDATVEQFRVFVDLNENGKLDFVDVNANNVFDNGIDIASEPMAITGPDGSYSIEVSTDDNLREDYFGNQLFFNTRYVGAEYYTVMLDYREGWSPTGIDVSEPGFADVLLNNGYSPGYAFHRLSMVPGETSAQLNFSVAPSSGSISGFVFNDLNRDGNRQVTEGGLGGATVFLDLDENGSLSASDVSVITGANGSYLFENLPAGVYDILIVAPPGYGAGDNTKPISGAHLNRTLATGQALGNGLVDFGFYDPNAVANTLRDYGDLPSPYATTGSQGASHGIVPGYHLGAGVSSETAGQPSAGANTDTSDDGVEFLSPITAGSLVRVNVTASSNALFLQGWIDFNNDGDFADAGEHIQFRDANGNLLPFGTQLQLHAGVNELSFYAPNSVDASLLAARFRYGEGGNAQLNKPNGAAILGEVEDYMLPANVSTSFVLPVAGDFDGSGTVDQGDYAVWKSSYGSTSDLRADGNNNGRVDLGDYTLWRDNLGAQRQVVQTVIAAAPAAIVSVEDDEVLPAALSSSAADGSSTPGLVTVSDSGLALFSAASESDEADPVAAANAAATVQALDLVFDLADDEDESTELSFYSENEDIQAEAFCVALEEEFAEML